MLKVQLPNWRAHQVFSWFPLSTAYSSSFWWDAIPGEHSRLDDVRQFCVMSMFWNDHLIILKSGCSLFVFFSNAEDVNFDGLFSFRPSVFMATSAPSIHARPEHRLCFSLCFRCVRSRQPAAGWYWDQSYSHLSFSFQSQCHFHADHMGVSWNRGTQIIHFNRSFLINQLF